MALGCEGEDAEGFLSTNNVILSSLNIAVLPKIYFLVIHLLLLIIGVGFVKQYKYTKLQRAVCKGEQPEDGRTERQKPFRCQHQANLLEKESLQAVLFMLWRKHLRDHLQLHLPLLEMTTNGDGIASIFCHQQPHTEKRSCSSILSVWSSSDSYNENAFAVFVRHVTFEAEQLGNATLQAENDDTSIVVEICACPEYQVEWHIPSVTSDVERPDELQALYDALIAVFNNSFLVKIGLETTRQSDIRRILPGSETGSRQEQSTRIRPRLNGMYSRFATSAQWLTRRSESRVEKANSTGKHDEKSGGGGTGNRMRRGVSDMRINRSTAVRPPSQELVNSFGWKINESSALLIETIEDGDQIYYHIPPRLSKENSYDVKGRKIHVYLDHFFVATCFIASKGSMPICEACSLPLAKVIGKQGYKCQGCGMIAHKRCHFMVSSPCLKRKRKNINLQFLGSTEV